RGVEISYAPDTIDGIFGFRPEYCSNETKIIMSRCHVVDVILRGGPIREGEMIARSIKRMVTGPNSYIGHPFVITTLCDRLQVPVDDNDTIVRPPEPLGRRFFRMAQRDLQVAEAAAAAPQPPPPAQQQELHQVPPHIPQQH
ncbi:hypothetical protein A2U01_0041275, partial [Trifolium medium]|nr:hypothetical protein [Trifolium medium]